MAKRLCITCEHFDVYHWHGGGGCDTCGFGGEGSLEISCDKSVFSREEIEEANVTQSLRKISKRAVTCKLYKEASDQDVNE